MTHSNESTVMLPKSLSRKLLVPAKLKKIVA